MYESIILSVTLHFNYNLKITDILLKSFTWQSFQHDIDNMYLKTIYWPFQNCTQIFSNLNNLSAISCLSSWPWIKLKIYLERYNFEIINAIIFASF